MTVSGDYDLSVSNEELLALCKRQDQDALRVLFRRHERWRSAVLAMATVSNDKTVVESTLRKALQHFDSRHDLEVVDQNLEIL